MKSQLLTTLQSGIKSKALFDKDYLEEVDTGDRTALWHILFTMFKITLPLPNSGEKLHLVNVSQ